MNREREKERERFKDQFLKEKTIVRSFRWIDYRRIDELNVLPRFIIYISALTIHFKVIT